MRGRGRSGSAIARLACAAVVTCGALACDPGEPAQPSFEAPEAAPPRDFASGTRLRARYHVIDGLVEVFTTFHDAELDVDCAYDDEGGAHVGPNGASYCFPAGMARHREGTGPYLDRLCTTRAAFTPRGAPATHALVEPRDACATEPEIHLARAPQVRRVFVRDAEGACLEAEGNAVQSLGDVVPLDTFVRAVEQIEPRDGRIGARVLVGSDGSRHAVGGFDRLRREASRVGTLADGTRRWLPARVAFVGGGELLFADAACAVPAAAKIARTATCPLAAAVVLDGTCGVGRYFELGDRVTSVFARDPTGACVARSTTDQLAFLLGEAVATSDYAPVASVDVGSGRVRRRGVGGAGDAPVAWGEVIDVDTNEACEVATVADGTLRCLPSASEVIAFFADTTCTEPAFARPTTGCEPGASARLVRDAFDVPPKVFAVGRELEAVYTVEGGRCVPFAPSVPSRLFAVSEIATTRFAPAVLAAD